ncbi:MAG: TonB-dependent receptor [Ferruginibacter sp.]|uniref:carboxypeptidase-like regulatory domain-containing protein n=1 Tax=Ferruginibacter sp. TaxID=1940288 RepID=UPI00265B3BCD|nr:carboxypeptidase-like regulatory domain-containing protein [Ferruginibacter sp.]MDB5277263.1 TonB-dependent receptor [Ferruginibacter sp.]
MKKNLLLLINLFVLTAFISAQNKTLTGKVTDLKDGTPLPAVTIRIKEGASIGVTNADGSFKVVVPAKTKALIFSSVNYSEIELPATTGDLSVKMEKGNKVLSEVIISGYVTRSKRSNTGSASVISADDVRSQPNASFDQLLQGQAPGLNVKTGSGQRAEVPML